MNKLQSIFILFLAVLNFSALANKTSFNDDRENDKNILKFYYSEDFDFSQSETSNIKKQGQNGIDSWNPKPVGVWTMQQRLITDDGRNGELNLARTLEALNDLGANAIFQPIGTSAQYYNLINLLDQLKGTNIKVWVQTHRYCKADPPQLNGDCLAWVKHLATLSLQYPNLKAIVLDDLHPDTDPTYITPAYITTLIDEINNINPDFLFLPTFYYDSGDELKYFREESEFKGVFRDGAFMWYWASWGSKNPINLNLYYSYIYEARSLFKTTHFITGFYTQKDGLLESTLNPDTIFHAPKDLKKMTEFGYDKSHGLALFNLPLHVYDLDFLYQATIFKQQANNDPAFTYRLTNSGNGTWTSWYQAIESTITAPAGSEIRVKFNMRDNRASGDAKYIFKQLLINDQVLWEEDITQSAAVATINKTVTLEKDNAKIIIRIFSKRANWISADAYVSSPVVYIDGNMVESTWNFDSNMTKINEYREVYDIVKNAIKSFSTGINVKEKEKQSNLDLIYSNGNLICNNYSGYLRIYLYNINGQLLYQNNKVYSSKDNPLIIDLSSRLKSNSPILLYKIIDEAGNHGSGKISIL